jgi:hypothetical protein
MTDRAGVTAWTNHSKFTDMIKEKKCYILSNTLNPQISHASPFLRWGRRKKFPVINS